jgi:hypothetical protein
MPYKGKWKSKTIYEGSVNSTHKKDTEKKPRKPRRPLRPRKRKKKKPVKIPIDTKSKKYKERMKDNEKYLKKTNSNYLLAQLLGMGYGAVNTMKYMY